MPTLRTLAGAIGAATALTSLTIAGLPGPAAAVTKPPVVPLTGSARLHRTRPRSRLTTQLIWPLVLPRPTDTAV
jgi:hypothetical protein